MAHHLCILLRYECRKGFPPRGQEDAPPEKKSRRVAREINISSNINSNAITTTTATRHPFLIPTVAEFRRGAQP